jgi:hypothetical protein
LEIIRTLWTLQDAIAAKKSGDVRLAQGYAWDLVAQRYVNKELPDLFGVFGSGVIISNVLDYVEWLKYIMNQTAPLSAAGHASVVAPRVVVSIPGNNPFKSPNLYALGWYIDTYRAEKIT